MSMDDETERPAGAGKAIEETWDKLRPDDEPAEDEDDLDDMAEAPDEDDAALDGELMDDPVDTVDASGDHARGRGYPGEAERDQSGVAPGRDPF